MFNVPGHRRGAVSWKSRRSFWDDIWTLGQEGFPQRTHDKKVGRQRWGQNFKWKCRAGRRRQATLGEPGVPQAAVDGFS